MERVPTAPWASRPSPRYRGGQFPGDAKLLTDGDADPRRVGSALSSAPTCRMCPSRAFRGRFRRPQVAVNAVVLHHGTWNGKTILYPARRMRIQYWGWENAWRDVAGAQTTWHESR